MKAHTVPSAHTNSRSPLDVTAEGSELKAYDVSHATEDADHRFPIPPKPKIKGRTPTLAIRANADWVIAPRRIPTVRRFPVESTRTIARPAGRLPRHDRLQVWSEAEQGKV
jgi:hypothetical protein